MGKYVYIHTRHSKLTLCIVKSIFKRLVTSGKVEMQRSLKTGYFIKGTRGAKGGGSLYSRPNLVYRGVPDQPESYMIIHVLKKIHE